MYNENNHIKIEKVENGYIVTIVLTRKELSPVDMINEFMPAIERIQNKATGDDWKNDINNEIDSALKAEQPKPVRQFVCMTWKEVLKIINAENI